MLQIISGKFFSDGEVHHNDCCGVLYSNLNFVARKPKQIDNLKITSVDWQVGLPTYVINYDNQIEDTPQTHILYKVGDEAILRQLKYIMTFSFDAFFDENEYVVEELCKVDNKHKDNIVSNFIPKTFDKERYIEETDWDKFEKFYNKVIGLKREEYNTIIKCLGAYSSALKIYEDDSTLSYCMFVYILETLSANFGGFTNTWEDYKEDKRIKLEKCFEKIDLEVADEIKKILITEEHLKLAKRFSEFILRYVDDDYYQYIEKKQLTEDELKAAIGIAYVTRSKYAHELRPINKHLLDGAMSLKSDVFEWEHELYFTYSGLIRLVRTVIYNFVMEREYLQKEDYKWYDELPGIIDIKMHPKYWLPQNIRKDNKSIVGNFEALIECIEYDHEVPSLEELVRFYVTNMNNISNDYRSYAYVFSWIYLNIVKGVEQTFKDEMQEKMNKYEKYMNSCNIPVLVGGNYGLPHPNFDLEEVEAKITEYNNKKYKKNTLRLPHNVENKLYVRIAEIYEKEKDINRSLEWCRKAFRNSVNNKELQEEIEEKIEKLSKLA